MSKKPFNPTLSLVKDWKKRYPDEILTAEVLLDLLGPEAEHCEKDWRKLGL